MSTRYPLSPLTDPRPYARADAPIGVFDSGIGGLSIAQEIAQYLPHENILYFADTAHVPYGARSDQEIRELTAHAIEWLYRQGCKIAVVACNTASAFSLDYLREHYGESFPIIGLVPALKPAILKSTSKTVAVLATPATFRGKLIKEVITHFAEPTNTKVIAVTCLDLVPLVESGQHFSDVCLKTLADLLQPIVDQGADYLVLGCTHYPFLKPAIEHLFPHQLTLIDSGLAVAHQTARILRKNSLLLEQYSSDMPRIRCYVSGGNADALHAIVQRLVMQTLSWDIQNLN